MLGSESAQEFYNFIQVLDTKQLSHHHTKFELLFSLTYDLSYKY